MLRKYRHATCRYIQTHSDTSQILIQSDCMYLVCICLYLSRFYLYVSISIVYVSASVFFCLSISDGSVSIVCVSVCAYVSVCVSIYKYVYECICYLHYIYSPPDDTETAAACASLARLERAEQWACAAPSLRGKSCINQKGQRLRSW
jgi:hypothetical protein